MKNRKLLAMLLIYMCACLFAQESENIGTLKVVVSGLKNDRGDIKIGLFDSAESYQGKAERFRGSNLSIVDKRAEWLIEGIPFGEYAVKLFHDEDKDNEIDKNFIGLPTESFGFSNNPKIRFGPPGFDKTKFLFNSKEMTIVIELK
jgi:uncharacterized protein (DUF2141 family)